MLRGWTLVKDPSLVVYHYHHQGYHFAYEVAYAVNYHFYKFFKFVPPVPAIPAQMLKAAWHIGKHQQLLLKQKIYWIFYNWRVQWGTFNSHVNFLMHLRLGGIRSLTRRYEKVCKTVPQGKQKKNE